MKRQLILWFFATNTVLKGHSWQGLWEHLLLGWISLLKTICVTIITMFHYSLSFFVWQEICILFPSFLLPNKYVRYFSVWQLRPQNHVFHVLFYFQFYTAKQNIYYLEANVKGDITCWRLQPLNMMKRWIQVKQCKHLVHLRKLSFEYFLNDLRITIA